MAMHRAIATLALTAILVAGGGRAQGQAQSNRTGGAITRIDFQRYAIGGRQYCWYPSAWQGAGWYWCGYAWRTGLGWGGGRGWNGWRHGGAHSVGLNGMHAGGLGGHAGMAHISGVGGGGHMGGGFGGDGHMGAAHAGGFGGGHGGGGRR